MRVPVGNCLHSRHFPARALAAGKVMKITHRKVLRHGIRELNALQLFVFSVFSAGGGKVESGIRMIMQEVESPSASIALRDVIHGWPAG